MRLNKFLAQNLGVSRREADKLIEAGLVKVGGKIAKLGERANDGEAVEYKNSVVEPKHEYIYLTINKPVGYVCSRKKQGDSPTIYDLIPEKYKNLKTVGRLDRNSSGLLILSDDGDFNYQMTHPKFYKTKIYQVRLDKDLEPLHQQMISDFGIQLEDGPSKLSLERRSDDNRREWIVTMHEGRNRQIRRTFLALGYTVKKLHRTNFGNYSLGDIKTGEFVISNTR